MTLGNSDGAGPTWSPDGKQIYFTSTANGPQEIYDSYASHLPSGEKAGAVSFAAE